MKEIGQTQPAKEEGSGIGEKRPATEYVSDADLKKPTVSTKQGFNITKRTLQSAFRGAVETWKLTFGDTDDVILQLKDGILAMEGRLAKFVCQRTAVKFTMALHVVFYKGTDISILTDGPARLYVYPRRLPKCMLIVISKKYF